VTRPTATDKFEVPAGAWKGARTLFVAAAVGGFLLAALGFAVDREQFFYSYLTAYVFFLTLCLGALFFTLVQHLSRAGWSVAVRRLAEAAGWAVPVFAVLFLPLLPGLGVVFHWAQPGAAAHDPVLAQKSGYLNVPFFLVRMALYFVIWTVIARYFYGRSVRQDESRDPMITVVLQRRAAPAMVLYALTFSFMSFDCLMSLTPHWFSTIFGVYVWSGGVLSALAFLTLVSFAIRRESGLSDVLRTDHFQDLGRLLFAFTVFWAYIAYSQFMLIWYGNLPEETVWFLPRIHGSWGWASLVLGLGHFAVPFMLLMSRWLKRRPVLVAATAVWVLLMCYFDIFWMVMPNLHHDVFRLSWLDLVCVIAVGGVFLSVFTAKLARAKLVPAGDPRLPESLALEHAY
jgi:hypothetical protein